MALAYSTLAGRALYADGAWYVLVHLLTPHRFNDYDPQRSFASYITQAPILFGQRFGVDSVAIYAALYSIGVFVIPALAMLVALFLSRRQPLLFAVNSMAIATFGFGANFINTESNLLFGLVLLSATIIALDRPAQILRGAVLPILAFALLRTYEGMLLIGPVLAAWAFVVASRSTLEWERFGLRLSGFLFVLGSIIGLGGFLAPRDPGNASSFLAHAVLFWRNPQIFLYLSALFAIPAMCVPRRNLRLVCIALVVIFGALFVTSILQLKGYYSYQVYHENRSFLVLLMPVLIAALFAAYWFRPNWIQNGPPEGSYAIMLLPLAFAIAGDIIGTNRWNAYVGAFCDVLQNESSPAERLAQLQRTGVMTAWRWTHPTMSVLLRDGGSSAMVINEPTAWEPFNPAAARAIPYRGLCSAPLVRRAGK
jgi:MFS family permease